MRAIYYEKQPDDSYLVWFIGVSSPVMFNEAQLTRLRNGLDICRDMAKSTLQLIEGRRPC